MSGLGLTLILVSCTKSTNVPELPAPKERVNEDKNKGLKITGVNLPFQIAVSVGMFLDIIGQGFVSGDQIAIQLLIGGPEINLPVASVTTALSTIIGPERLMIGRHELYVVRDAEKLLLGVTTLNVVLNADIPDREGMTIKGVVYALGKGVVYVVVSDGRAVTKTDADGIYYLPP